MLFSIDDSIIIFEFSASKNLRRTFVLFFVFNVAIFNYCSQYFERFVFSYDPMFVVTRSWDIHPILIFNFGFQTNNFLEFLFWFFRFVPVTISNIVLIWFVFANIDCENSHFDAGHNSNRTKFSKLVFEFI